MIRLFIVAGQPALAQGLRMRMVAEPDLVVVGEAADCEDALRMVATLRPDVVLVDFNDPRRDETAITDTLVSVCHHVPVIILSMHADSLGRVWADRADVAAFVAMSEPVEALLATIRQVAGGDAPVPPAFGPS